jgi:hypothetical protein
MEQDPGTGTYTDPSGDDHVIHYDIDAGPDAGPATVTDVQPAPADDER